MARATLSLTVIEDFCLGHKVYRGTATAKELVEASWVDVHDPDVNQYGYQRAFTKSRSEEAAKYANEVKDAFWPECILAIRKDDEDTDEDTDEDEQVDFTFTPINGSNGRFGSLSVDYEADGIAEIDGVEVPWRRAFSQVDCQHRLGSLGGASHQVTFCIFPGITRQEEAVIFRTINDTQRKMNTSLVDTISLVTDPNASLHIKLAWKLGMDVGSPFYKRVWTGGNDQKQTFINLRGLKEALRRLMPTGLARNEDGDFCYTFARNFWQSVEELWPTEFVDKTNNKLQTTAGQGGIAAFGQRIFRSAIPAQEISKDFIKNFFKNDPNLIDWSSSGETLGLATGKGGQKNVLAELERVYG